MVAHVKFTRCQENEMHLHEIQGYPESWCECYENVSAVGVICKEIPLLHALQLQPDKLTIHFEVLPKFETRVHHGANTKCNCSNS